MVVSINPKLFMGPPFAETASLARAEMEWAKPSKSPSRFDTQPQRIHAGLRNRLVAEAEWEDS